MKKYLILIFFSLSLWTIQTQAQGTVPTQRISFSSGGGSNLQMPVSMGEPFGSATVGGNVTIGSQQNNNAGGVGILPTLPKNRIVVFPNPVENELNVQVIGDNENGFSVKLHDLLGREILSQKDIQQYTKLSLIGMPGNTFLVTIYDKDGLILFSETVVKP